MHAVWQHGRVPMDMDQLIGMRAEMMFHAEHHLEDGGECFSSEDWYEPASSNR